MAKKKVAAFTLHHSRKRGGLSEEEKSTGQTETSPATNHHLSKKKSHGRSSPTARGKRPRPGTKGNSCNAGPHLRAGRTGEGKKAGRVFLSKKGKRPYWLRINPGVLIKESQDRNPFCQKETTVVGTPCRSLRSDPYTFLTLLSKSVGRPAVKKSLGER